MNTSADPRAVPNLTYATCARVRELGPACMATFAALTGHRIERLCHERPAATDNRHQTAPAGLVWPVPPPS